MPLRSSRLAQSAAQSELAAALAALKAELDVPLEFTPEALAEAEAARAPEPELDLRDVPFATLDPASSRDLDQAFYLERSGEGFTVRYAIADVPGFVSAEGNVDAAARERGQTLYAADGSIPLHPRTLSEDRASLLPDVDRPAFVWTFEMDSAGSVDDFRLERALIRSRAKLDYVSVQAALDRGEDSPASLLAVIGPLRAEIEADRGGASLSLPDEVVVRNEDGTCGIVRESPLAVEEWNAQLSLMTGMGAARMMLEAGVGILRTMPRPDQAAFETFRRQTRALEVPWREGDYGEYLRSLDRDDPHTLPVLQAAASLFRGAGYLTFDGDVPAETIQAAIAAPYAHATAPLRRLVDRWALAICLDVSQGREAPEWARASLAELPEIMQSSSRRAGQLGSATLNTVEAALLRPYVGQQFEATVLELRGHDGDRAVVQIAEPPVTHTIHTPAGALPGDVVTLTLADADIATGTLEFS
ncbi:RNB domain-containing protein [Ruaniaceae bacterium KH17]|nr:RNB domain-containing protein [Ruaniaceae bacterium KH17]